MQGPFAAPHASLQKQGVVQVAVEESSALHCKPHTFMQKKGGVARRQKDPVLSSIVSCRGAFHCPLQLLPFLPFTWSSGGKKPTAGGRAAFSVGCTHKCSKDAQAVGQGEKAAGAPFTLPATSLGGLPLFPATLLARSSSWYWQWWAERGG